MGTLMHRPLEGVEAVRAVRGAVLVAGRTGGLEAEARSALAVAVSETARRLQGRGWVSLEVVDRSLRASFGGPEAALREAAERCSDLVPEVRIQAGGESGGEAGGESGAGAAGEAGGEAVLVLERWMPQGDHPAVAGALERLARNRGVETGDEDPADREVRELLARLRAREQELERLDAELEETNRGVVALYAELDERDQRKNEFLATLAHELRNPLGVVGTALHAVRERNGHEEDVARPLELAERQLWHLARLVDDLLDISRIDQGKINLRQQALDLTEILSRALDSCRGVIRGRNHRLDVQLTDEPLPLRADPVRVEQVVDNLLSNAAKYTPEGGNLWVRTRREGDFVVLEVEDDGVGISPAMLDRIFQRFAQADETLDRSGGGLGLGLALVDRLVALHGGQVTAHSEGEGQGSLFTVRLPLAGAGEAGDAIPPPPVATEEEESMGSDEPLEVLLVEDNDDAREMMALLLEGRGFRVTTAGDGPEGVERGTGGDFDAAVVDIGLPGLDGYEVARRLRADEATSDMLLVALSGYGRPEDRDRSSEAGFDHHLVKPVEPDELCRVLSGGRGAPRC